MAPPEEEIQSHGNVGGDRGAEPEPSAGGIGAACLGAGATLVVEVAGAEIEPYEEAATDLKGIAGVGKNEEEGCGQEGAHDGLRDWEAPKATSPA